MTDAPQQLPEDRDKRGRFAAGNRFGRGNQVLRRAGELRAAVDAAVSVDDLRQVLGKLRDLAVGGDVQAAQTLLVHCIGRPRERAADLNVDLGDLRTGAGVAAALRRIAAAAAGGEIRTDDAAALAGLVGAAADATLLEQIEQRLAALEVHRAQT